MLIDISQEVFSCHVYPDDPGPADAPMEVHLILLGAEVVLLEGIVLDAVTEGKYFLSALPLNLGGCDGAPCRAVLWDMQE